MRTLLKKYALAMLVFTFAFMLSACELTPPQKEGSSPSTNPDDPSAGDASWHYIIPATSDTESILIDQSGKEIMQADYLYFPVFTEYTNSFGIPEQHTKPLYVMVADDTLHTGSRTNMAVKTALYSVDGTLLRDFETGYYKAAFGEYVIFTNVYDAGNDGPNVMNYEGDTAFSCLLHPVTNTVLFDDVWKIDSMADNLWALKDTNGDVRYIVDSSMNIIFEDPFSFPCQYIEKCGDYYLAAGYCLDVRGNDAYHWTIFDAEMNPVSDPYDYIAYTTSTYFLFEDVSTSQGYSTGVVQSVFDAATSKIIFSEKGLSYYDDDLYLTATWVGGTGTQQYVLATTSDNVLASARGQITPYSLANGLLATQFYTYSIEEETLGIIDRAGKEIASIEVPSVYVFTFINDNWVLVHTNAGYYFVLNNQLEYVTTSDYLYDIGIVHPTKDASYFIAVYSSANSACYDIIDFEGNITAHGISEIYTSNSTYAVVKWNDKIGLINALTGEWIYQTKDD